MVSVIANGGMLYRPYVVKTIEDSKGTVLSEATPHGERVISADTAANLQDMLEVVVTEGTATAGKLEGYTAAGKTGTAQKIDETGHYSKTKFVASFAGFAPASNPVIAIIVVIDEPTGQHMGGEVAAPVFKKVAEPILRYMSVPPDAPSYAPQYTVKRESKPARAPIVKPNTPSAVFSPKLVAAGFAPSSVDSGVEFGDTVVPDFSGESLRQVTQDCLKAGLRLQSIGSGAAIQQSPPPGTTVSAGARIEVRFSTRLAQR
jgi:membrane peptidoglycan carboxypeptidase